MSKSEKKLKEYLSDLNLTSGRVVSLLKVLEHTLSSESDDPNMVWGCVDLTEKILEEARKILVGLDSVNIPFAKESK